MLTYHPDVSTGAREAHTQTARPRSEHFRLWGETRNTGYWDDQGSVMDEGGFLEPDGSGPEVILTAIKAAALLDGKEEAPRVLSFQQ